MDTLLITVTVLSLAMAMGMGIMLARLLREERRRSDARVAALSAMADEPMEMIGARTIRPAAPPLQVPLRLARAGDVADLELRPADSAAAVTGVGDLFSQPERSSPWGRRFVVIGGLAAGVTLVAALTLRSPHETVARQERPPAAPAEVAPVSAPLELLSLRYAQDEQGLTVSGLVRNPRGGATISRAVASAFVFGADGAFLSSGRAPLDFTTLEPGSESPFAVAVPVKGAVARYRIGFRNEEGGVLSHVDKRGPDALALK
jgi:hypothetical protein